MTIERYPANLTITEQDFVSCGWKDFLTSTDREGYSSMWRAFSAAARQAIEEGRQSHGKVLWLLADACSMALSPKSINDPFKPFMVMEDRRSVIPDDLPEADVIFFSQIVDLVDDVWLKARLADLVWLLQRKLGTKFALDAIDAYMGIPLDTNTWVAGGHECWERAISLSLMLKAGLAIGSQISRARSLQHSMPPRKRMVFWGCGYPICSRNTGWRATEANTSLPD